MSLLDFFKKKEFKYNKKLVQHTLNQRSVVENRSKSLEKLKIQQNPGEHKKA